MESRPQRDRYTVEEYQRMGEIGVLAPDARVELIEGEIIDMPAIGNPHNSMVDQLNRLFVRAVADEAIVRVQGSVRLGRRSEPQPDLVLLRPRADFYSDEFATGADMLLVIEVSDTTLHYDRDVKMPLYARHGVPEAWIVDVENNELHVHATPDEGHYRQRETVAAPGPIRLTALPHVSVDLSGLVVRKR